MWKIETKIKNNFDKIDDKNKTRIDSHNISKLIVPFENDKKKRNRHCYHHYFLRNSRTFPVSAIAFLSSEKRWKIVARWMEGGRGGQ